MPILTAVQSVLAPAVPATNLTWPTPARRYISGAKTIANTMEPRWRM